MGVVHGHTQVPNWKATSANTYKIGLVSHPLQVLKVFDYAGIGFGSIS
jgi:hypothetical protein